MTAAGKIALVGVVALVLAYALSVLGTAPAASQAERAEIARMTQGQRSQLRRRYREFQQLTTTERQKIFHIHQAVQENEALATTLARYTHFVAHLEPWERETLEDETDGETRLAKVRDMIAEGGDRAGSMRRPSWMTGDMVRGTTFRSEDFRRILHRLLASLMRPHPPIALDTLEGEYQAVKLVTDRSGGPKRPPGPPPPPEKPPWPPAQLTRHMLRLVPDEGLREFLLENEHIDDSGRRWALDVLLARTLMEQWQRAVPQYVPRSEIRKVIEGFKEKDRHRWTWREPERLLAAVMRQLARRSGEIGDFATRYGVVRQLYRRLDPRADHDDDHEKEDGDDRREDDDHGRHEHGNHAEHGRHGAGRGPRPPREAPRGRHGHDRHRPPGRPPEDRDDRDRDEDEAHDRHAEGDSHAESSACRREQWEKTFSVRREAAPV